MHCLLIYDIPSDKIRKKVADACLDYGLDRVQYSAFHGNLSRNLQGELFQKTSRLLGKQDGSIWLIPIGEKEWQTQSRLINGAVGDVWYVPEVVKGGVTGGKRKVESGK
jgi:CRISPR-associated protein Cas2